MIVLQIFASKKLPHKRHTDELLYRVLSSLFEFILASLVISVILVISVFRDDYTTNIENSSPLWYMADKIVRTKPLAIQTQNFFW